jgi:MFS family permease
VPAFRTVWAATLVANIGAWMASVGTGWLMTTLDPSPIMVSLVGAATALPMFLFALPAGALADIVDRRKLLIVAQIFMLAVMVVLCVLTMMGAITPVTLLILILVLEAGSAFETPAFLAVLPELVPKDELSQTLALNGLGINISRVLGPALGGLVIGVAGVSATFLLNAVTFFAVIFAYASWRPPAHSSHLPAERFTAAICSGWRFTREAPALKATLVHAGTFFLFASSYWALLPLIARDQLGGGTHVYGVLFGSIGAGAVAGALLLPAIRGRISPDRLVLGGGLVAGVMALPLPRGPLPRLHDIALRDSRAESSKSGPPDLRAFNRRSRASPRSVSRSARARALAVSPGHALSGPGPVMTSQEQRPPQEIVISVICITLASARLVYGPKVAERSTMVVGPLPRPSGRFLPRLGPAAPARGASFFRVCGEKPGEEAAASHPRKKSAPAQGRRADLVIR